MTKINDVIKRADKLIEEQEKILKEKKMKKQTLKKKAIKPKSKLVVNQAPCLCGCGGIPVGKKSSFLPGHDARLKGILLKTKTPAAKAKLKSLGWA